MHLQTVRYVDKSVEFHIFEAQFQFSCGIGLGSGAETNTTTKLSSDKVPSASIQLQQHFN